MKFFSKILVSNRGEIAIRVIRAAKEMGIRTVAIYSAVDRNALHVRMADEVFDLGITEVKEPYLDQDRILNIARTAQVDAIHPGYGFLSENADFASKAQKLGIEFIGPTPEAIRLMGGKIAAKKKAEFSGVKVILGSEDKVESYEKAEKIAKEIGYPILIKATAGGGGKGMRIVRDPKDLQKNFQRATSEALESFGDGSMFIEKLIDKPKHIEIQVLSDKYGNCIHLNERDCSVQRRYQKVVEEAPSIGISSKLRSEIGESAKKIARSCNYIGAGTVEFVVDREQNYYFLEMNTRLQVEHPITELITGIDLVKEQIRIAQGYTLPYSQEDILINGHAIELRVYAEDPDNHFFPDPGHLTVYSIPKGPGVRIDDGYEQGLDIPLEYDPLIAKLVVHGRDRMEAIQRMKRAIDEFKISGVKNTLKFGKQLLNHQAFLDGTYTTHFIDDHFTVVQNPAEGSKENQRIAAALAGKLFYNQIKRINPCRESLNTKSNWKNR